MKIAFKCARCGFIYMDDSDDMTLEIDFKEQKMTYICHSKTCHYENVMDFKTWQKQQKHSPLPRIGTLSG